MTKTTKLDKNKDTTSNGKVGLSGFILFVARFNKETFNKAVYSVIEKSVSKRHVINRIIMRYEGTSRRILFRSGIVLFVEDRT